MLRVSPYIPPWRRLSQVSRAECPILEAASQFPIILRISETISPREDVEEGMGGDDSEGMMDTGKK